MGLLKGNDPDREKRLYAAAQRELEEDERQKNIYKQAILEARRGEEAEKNQKRAEMAKQRLYQRLFRTVMVIAILGACLIFSAFLAIRLLATPSTASMIMGPGRTATAAALHTTSESRATEFAPGKAPTKRSSPKEGQANQPEGAVKFNQTSLTNPAPFGSTLAAGDILLRIVKVQRPAEVGNVQPGKETILIQLDFSCNASSEKTCTLAGFADFFLVGSQRVQYSPAPVGVQDELTGMITIYGDTNQAQWIGFYIDPADTDLMLALRNALDPAHSGYMALE